MLHEQTTKHIESLGDAELLEYVLMGQRLYEQEAVVFARMENSGRKRRRSSAMKSILA